MNKETLKEEAQRIKEETAHEEEAFKDWSYKHLKLAIKEAQTFNIFFEDNTSLLIDYAEESTGEEFYGLEPLLNMDSVKEIAKELWAEEHTLVCEKCGGETGVFSIGDESHDKCRDCGWITNKYK